MIWIFIDSEEPEIKSKQGSKRIRTLIKLLLFLLGALNFTIGQDVIDGFGENEFARIREEAEFSAVYLVPNPPNNTEESTDNQGNWLKGNVIM